MPLSGEALIAMEEVKLAATSLRNVRMVAAARAKALEEEIIAEAEAVTDKAVRKASDAGVSMQRIADEAMGYHNPFWVRESLKRTAATSGPTTEVRVFRRIPDTDHISIKIDAFPTTSTATDYPPTLQGIVRANRAKPNGWESVEDPTDMPGLPGFISWELSRRPTPGQRHLALDLNEWAAHN